MIVKAKVEQQQYLRTVSAGSCVSVGLGAPQQV